MPCVFLLSFFGKNRKRGLTVLITCGRLRMYQEQHTLMSPSQPSPHKQILGARISRELYHKFETLAARKGLKMTDLLVEVLERETREVILTPEQYEKIAEEIRLASVGQNARKQKRSKAH